MRSSFECVGKRGSKLPDVLIMKGSFTVARYVQVALEPLNK